MSGTLSTRASRPVARWAGIALVSALLAPVPALAQVGAPQQRVAPRGDYNETCTAAYVNMGRLYADCRDNRGRIRGTSIELDRCSAFPIRNNDGLLVCGNWRGDFEGGNNGGGNGPGGPGGGWGGGNGGGRNAITVYRDAYFRGQSTTFRGEVPNLRETGFNDVISSMRFRGAWIACTDAYFRGQCQTFTDDVSNLQRWGMNDRISSLRPAR